MISPFHAGVTGLVVSLGDAVVAVVGMNASAAGWGGVSRFRVFLHRIIQGAPPIARLAKRQSNRIEIISDCRS
jgi:hypothetical protein